nr:MAG TPA: hypothetical protein [Crassvirales sp.]
MQNLILAILQILLILTILRPVEDGQVYSLRPDDTDIIL